MTTKRKAHTLRKELHRLVDELPDRDLYAAKRFLAYLRNTSDPLVQKLMEAPYDDEPVTEEEEAALAEAYEDLAAGRVVPHEEARRRLLEQP